METEKKLAAFSEGESSGESNGKSSSESDGEKENLRKEIKNFQQWATMLGGLALVIGSLICLVYLLVAKPWKIPH